MCEDKRQADGPGQESVVIAGASVYNKKYFINPFFSALPKEIQEEIKGICITYAEKLHCVFMIRFGLDGEVYFDTLNEDNDFNYDEIGAKLDVDKITKEHKELILSLKKWYLFFQTSDGIDLLNALKKGKYQSD